jgi:hypothetical protein
MAKWPRPQWERRLLLDWIISVGEYEGVFTFSQIR